MKTLKVGEDIVRKTDEEAHKMVLAGKAVYCPKSLWKKTHKKPVSKSPVEEVKKEPKVKKARSNPEAEAKYREKKALKDR